MKWTGSPWGEVIALLGGILLTLSFSPFDLPPLAIIALLMLLLSWQQVSQKKAVWRGYLFGLGLYGAGVSWVYVSIHDFGGANVLVAGALTTLLAAFMALFLALASWLSVAFFKDRPIMRLLLVFPAIWTLVEWSRSWFLTGFPWLQVGYSQINTPLSGLAPITGLYGLSWVSALTAASMLAAWELRSWRRWGLMGLLLLAWLGAGALTLIEWTRPVGLAFQATLIQANIPQSLKWLPQQQAKTLQLYTDMTRKHWDSRLIVWPETAIPGFYKSLSADFKRSLTAEANKHNTDILLGVLASGAKADEYYNTMMAVGSHPGAYYKRHLVPFGEYLPLQPVSSFIADLIQIPMSDFSAGHDQQKPLYAADYLLAPSICYEDIFGQESLLGLPDAAYLVNITNDAWWGNSLAPHQHLQMARFRALETGRYMLRATNTGATAFIDAKGKIISHAPLFERTALTDWVTPMTGSTPYIRFGDKPILWVLFLSLGLAWLVSLLGFPRRGVNQKKRSNTYV